MEKVKDRILQHSFGPVRIDLDDFYAIIHLLENRHKGLKIAAGGFLLANPQEIEKLSVPQIRDLTIETDIMSGDSLFEFRFGKYGTSLMIQNEGLVSVGLMSEIVRIVDRPTLRWVERIRNFLPGIVAGFAVGGGGVFIERLPSLPRRGVAAVLLLLLLLAIATTAWSAFHPMGAILFIRRNNQQQSFVERHKDFIQKLVLLIVGALLTLLVQWVAKHYF